MGSKLNRHVFVMIRHLKFFRIFFFFFFFSILIIFCVIAATPFISDLKKKDVLE